MRAIKRLAIILLSVYLLAGLTYTVGSHLHAAIATRALPEWTPASLLTPFLTWPSLLAANHSLSILQVHDVITLAFFTIALLVLIMRWLRESDQGQRWAELIAWALKFTSLAYLGVGLVSSIAGYSMSALSGKATVFHPLVGIPLNLLGWPMNLNASIRSQVLSFQSVIEMLAILFVLLLMAVLTTRLPKPWQPLDHPPAARPN
mgnify:CR=1 FL=1